MAMLLRALRVTHSGLADQPIARKDYGGGWPVCSSCCRSTASRS